MRPCILAIVALVAASLPTVSAQSPPKRPHLAAGADTNDARAYYARGVDLLTQDAWTAAAAFYWATRLEPGWAEALYAQRVAGLMAQEPTLMGYLEGVRSVIESRQARRLDSLEYQAERLNPFFARDLDEQLYVGYLIAAYKREQSRSAEQPLDPRNEAELRYLVDQYLRSGTNVSVRAALAASQRRFAEALRLYRDLLPQYRIKASIRTERARIFYTMTAYPQVRHRRRPDDRPLLPGGTPLDVHDPRAAAHRAADRPRVVAAEARHQRLDRGAQSQVLQAAGLEVPLAVETSGQ